MPQSILLIEDEESLARFVELELTHEGYSVCKCFDGREGLETALRDPFDLILLDIMLPSLNGLEVLRRFRREKSTPVILLTARDAVMDKVNGLDTGADDYITKGPDPRRAEEAARRCGGRSDEHRPGMPGRAAAYRNGQRLSRHADQPGIPALAVYDGKRRDRAFP